MTEQRLIELRMVNLLRDFDYAREFGAKIKPKYLSPTGAMVWKTVKKRLDKERGDVLRARADIKLKSNKSRKDKLSFRLSLKDLSLLLRNEYPRHDLTDCKTFLQAMKDYDRDFDSPGVVKELFETALHRAILHEVSTLAANQLDSGKLDIEAVKEAVAPAVRYGWGNRDRARRL